MLVLHHVDWAAWGAQVAILIGRRRAAEIEIFRSAGGGSL